MIDFVYTGRISIYFRPDDDNKVPTEQPYWEKLWAYTTLRKLKNAHSE